MNYPDGRKIMVGDRLKLWEGCYGTVHTIVDEERVRKHPNIVWEYRISIATNFGLITFDEPKETFELIEREPRSDAE